MKRMERNPLLDLLLKCRKKPALLIGVQSVIVLENYIDGYIDACREIAPNGETVQWYDSFKDYIAVKFEIKDEYFCISTKILELGYTDEDGAIYFLELLEAFLQDMGGYELPQKKPSCLQPGEVRAFRLGKGKALDLIADSVREKSEEYFGLKLSDSDNLTFYSLKNGDVICAVGSDFSAIKNCEAELYALPAINSAEKIRYEILRAKS